MCVCICPGWLQMFQSQPSVQRDILSSVYLSLKEPKHFIVLTGIKVHILHHVWVKKRANRRIATGMRGLPCLFRKLETSSLFPRSAAHQPAPLNPGWPLYHSCIQSGSWLCGYHSSVMLLLIDWWRPKPSQSLENTRIQTILSDRIIAALRFGEQFTQKIEIVLCATGLKLNL